MQITLQTQQMADDALVLRVRQAINNNKMARTASAMHKQKFADEVSKIEDLLASSQV
jgi:hypothetical protein